MYSQPLPLNQQFSTPRAMGWQMNHQHHLLTTSKTDNASVRPLATKPSPPTKLKRSGWARYLNGARHHRRGTLRWQPSTRWANATHPAVAEGRASMVKLVNHHQPTHSSTHPCTHSSTNHAPTHPCLHSPIHPFTPFAHNPSTLPHSPHSPLSPTTTHTFTHAPIHPSTHSSIRPLAHPSVHPHIHAYNHPVAQPPTRTPIPRNKPCIPSPPHAYLIYPSRPPLHTCAKLIHSPIHPPTHPSTHPVAVAAHPHTPHTHTQRAEAEEAVAAPETTTQSQ